MKIRASRKRCKPRCVKGERATRIFEASMRKRADALLGSSFQPRSFEQIYEKLSSLRTAEARDLRKTIANYFSLK
ncbi:MAG: hypothetical protein Q8O51_00495 [bacterium]|nr:hypothetical protein [bacterium]